MSNHFQPIQYSLIPDISRHFGVHYHHATRAHYDLRLEVGECAHSYVLPDGPSLDPKEKRELIRMDDHPRRCLYGEGRIPAGNYGAGPMIMWDWGNYWPIMEDDMPFEVAIEIGLEIGYLRLRFDGVKLCGDWEMRKRGQKWTFRKLPDEYASDVEILLQDRSVISGRRITDL